MNTYSTSLTQHTYQTSGVEQGRRRVLNGSFKFMTKKIPIEVSARHIHLSKKDLEILFGKNYKLKTLKKLKQSGNFVAKETVFIEANERMIKNVRVVGPVRGETQVELSHTDAIFLKIKPIVRDSGDIGGTPGIVIIGNKGKVKIREGVINAWRHIHCGPKKAEKLGIKTGDLVSVKTEGVCAITFHNVKIRVDKKACLCMHLDTDEGNAACITKKGQGFLI